MSDDENLKPVISSQQQQMLTDLSRRAGEGGTDTATSQGGESVMLADPQLAEIADAIAAVLTPTFAIVAPNWRMQPREVSELSKAYAPVVLKHFPDGLGDVGPELAAIFATATILGSRIGTPRRIVIVREDAPGDEKAAA